MSRRAAAAFAALMAACSHAPAAPPAQAPDAVPAPSAVATYFPLAVGNEWNWLDRSPADAAGTARRRTVRILSRDGDGYFVDSEKGALRVAAGCIQDRSRSILCGPLQVGTAWSSVVSLGSTERYQIAGVDERVSVAAGTFEGCVRVRARARAGEDAENVLEITYAPGVGPVRIETSAVVKGRPVPQFRAELESYRLEGRTR